MHVSGRKSSLYSAILSLVSLRGTNTEVYEERAVKDTLIAELRMMFVQAVLNPWASTAPIGTVKVRSNAQLTN